MNLSGKDFLTLKDFDSREIRRLLDLAAELKREEAAGQRHEPMRGKLMAMIFQKPSLRTRVSFETGMFQLGGGAIYLGPAEIGLGKRESVKDIRFQMGMITRTIQEESYAKDQGVVLDDAERERIEAALHPLQDAETREIVRRIMIKGASAKKTANH